MFMYVCTYVWVQIHMYAMQVEDNGDRSCLYQAIWTSSFGTGYLTESEVYCSVLLVGQQSPGVLTIIL